MISRHCDMCLIREKPGAPVLQFSLIQTIHSPGKSTTRGAGSLLLCSSCWTRSAKPRMRSVRARARAAEDRRSAARLQAAGVEVAA